MIHWKQSGTACRPMGKAARPHCAGEEMNVKNKILVIEDEASISELICMNLGIGGYLCIRGGRSWSFWRKRADRRGTWRWWM